MKEISVKVLSPNSVNNNLFVEKYLLSYMLPYFSPFYPRFNSWFNNKVITGFHLNKRSIICVLHRSSLCGVSIVKLGEDKWTNNKICSLYLEPFYRNCGIGNFLVSKSFEQISNFGNGQKTIITVPEEKLEFHVINNGFEKFLHGFGFSSTEKTTGRYREGKMELVFSRDEDYCSNTSTEKTRVRVNTYNETGVRA